MISTAYSIFVFYSPDGKHVFRDTRILVSVRLGLPEGLTPKPSFCRYRCLNPWRSWVRSRPPWLMHNLFQWISSYASVLAILVTLGVAVLLVCCLECTHCPNRDKDDIFSRHEM